ncbi:MAG: hypothetical protein ABI927_03975 [Gaiellaceae bacterium]
MERVGEHPLKAGPLAVRWLAHKVEPPRAGITGRARLVLGNAGSATWRARGETGVRLAYHWLDPLGNAIVWDGIRTAFPRAIAPGETVEIDIPVEAPRPPGGYVLSFDLVEEFRFWFADIGSATLDVPTEVGSRIAERRLEVVVLGGRDPETTSALSAQEEALVENDAVAVAYLCSGAVPAPDWSRLLLDAHAEGWAAVGGAVEPVARRDRGRFGAWAPGSGRNPHFGSPLLFPSLLDGIKPGEHEGLPAYNGVDGLFDGRAVVRLRPQSGRRPG